MPVSVTQKIGWYEEKSQDLRREKQIHYDILTIVPIEQTSNRTDIGL